MPLDRLPPDDPLEWLNRARSNLLQARQRTPGVYLEDLCFNAQQAVEKALKAVLLKERGDFPPVHQLGYLVRVLDEMEVAVPPAVWRAVRLTDYAVQARYPGPADPVVTTEWIFP
jgi:HEPN domain-containing protein